VRRTPADKIVEFLSFSTDLGDCVHELDKFTPREWRRILGWLDDAGLAFYFLEKLKNTTAGKAAPTWVMSSLERNFAANQQRVEDMSHRFGALNQKFNDAGVRYAVLKGFSLVLQFCPDAALRHLSDLDYLVDEQSLSAAQRIVLEAGYRPKSSPSSQESIFVMTGMGEPSRSAEQYDVRAPHAVELHLDIWDSDQHKLPIMPRQFFVERATPHSWSGFAFPALADEDAFLLQILHACQHLFTYWIRMSCLFEIGYFLNRRASDPVLWKRVEERVGENLMLREFVVVITELVGKLFAPPIPSLVRAWGSSIRPGPRVWIENYARYSAFCDLPGYDFRLFPRAKLVLFLLQQYRDACTPQHLLGDRMLPSSRLSSMVSSVKNKPSLLLDAAWWKRQLLFKRSLFHALAALRYFYEIPRWKWLNRARMRSVSADV